MKQTVYGFDKVHHGRSSNYIFQRVYGRRLSPIVHSHDFYELSAVLEGRCTHEIDGERCEMQSGTVALLRPGDVHVFIDQSDDLEMIGLSVRREEFERVCEVLGDGTVARIQTGEIPLLAHSCELMLRKDRVLAIPQAVQCDRECVMLLLALVKALMDSKERESALPPVLRRAMDQMKEREHLRRGIAAMVELSGYSQSHLFRLVRQHLGVDPSEYVRTLRLEAAYRDLTATRLPPEEIAEGVGYESYSHFHRIFKQAFGITPAELRKRSGTWAT